MAITNSIIVPAYKEKLNIKPLTTRLFAALGNEACKTTELIFVDDNSQDGSVEEVEALKKSGYNVRIIVRMNVAFRLLSCVGFTKLKVNTLSVWMQTYNTLQRVFLNSWSL